MDDLAGQFLYWLSAFKKPSRILEIGFGSGYSALWMASGFPETRIVSLEKRPDRYEAGLDLLKQFPDLKITLLFEDARQYLKNAGSEKFDLVFFDGVKSQYGEYFKMIRPHLNPEALLVADNLLYRGRVFEESLSLKKQKELKKSRAFYEALSLDQDFVSVFLPVADGMALGIYRGEA